MVNDSHWYRAGKDVTDRRGIRCCGGTLCASSGNDSDEVHGSSICTLRTGQSEYWEDNKTPGAAHGAQVLFKKDIEYVIQEIANETHDRPQAQCLATDTKNFR